MKFFLSSVDSNVLDINLSDNVFCKDYNEALVHQVIVSYLSNARSGTSAQKSRGQVSGGGIKPWRQKGTGRARAGSIRSPLWRGGGVIFAAKPRSYYKKINKKMYRGAMCCIFSQLAKENRINIVEKLTIDTFKTKLLINYLHSLNLYCKLLIVVEEFSENIVFSARNLNFINIIEVNKINPVILLKHEKVLFTKAAIEKVEEVFCE